MVEYEHTIQPGADFKMRTIEVAMAESWPVDRIAVRGEDGKSTSVRVAPSGGERVVRFDVAPRDMIYRINLRR